MRPRTGKTIGLFATALLTSLSVGSAHGGVAEFTNKDAWIAAVDHFTTVDFVGFPPGTFITEQYAGLGIHFTDGNDSITPLDTFVFPNDGSGLDGNGDINVSFDIPQLWIAVDYPGSIQFELFLQDQLVYTSSRFLPGGIGNFAGLLSTELFDAARLIDVVGTDAEIDDLHFGVPACPADLDGDRTVAVPDLLALLAAWGTNPGGPPDFDGDGVVAVPDLLTLLANWGPCP